MAGHIRIARPVTNLARTSAMYMDGLGLTILGRFEDHDGFDGVILGEAGGACHFEFTHCRPHPVRPTPTPEDLVVFYVPDRGDWARRCASMHAAGFKAVASLNPYWDRDGCTFEDPDGYRVVIQCAAWAGSPEPRHRVVIFGNSGSGKSTLAREKAEALGCRHLDLDTIAWEDGCSTPTRRSLETSGRLLAPFLADNESWVVEGCYADLLELAVPHCTELVFLNPGVEVCEQNCRSRPWEPHKYDSPASQDANLEMLLAWVRQYPDRDDEFSLRAHRRIFDGFAGRKREVLSNDRPDA